MLAHEPGRIEQGVDGRAGTERVPVHAQITIGITSDCTRGLDVDRAGTAGGDALGEQARR